MDQSPRATKILLVLFALPFLGFGMIAVLSGLRNLSAGGPLSPMVIPAAVFSLIGFSLIAAVLYASKKAKATENMRAEHPEQPWLWREDWSRGRANSKTKSNMITAWAIATVWMLVSSPMLFVVTKEQLQQQPKIYFIMLFPAFGVFLLVRAVRETMRWLEFGKTCFEMATVPFVVGQSVRGTIQARFSHLPKHGVQVKLSCIHRIVTGSGKNQSTQEKIVWRDEKLVPPEMLCAGPIGTGIPVEFSVPADAMPTNGANPRAAIFWLIEADADVPGVDYQDVFEVPVFRTKETSSVAEPRMWGNAVPGAPADHTISVRTGSGGGTEFYFPPARNKGFATGTTAFTTLWSGISVAMFVYNVPFIFPMVFGLFGLVMIYISLELWLGTSTVVVGSGSLRVRMGLLGSGKTQEIPFSQIAKVQTMITSQQGGSTGTPYYDIQLFTTAGKMIPLGKTLRDKQEADWLVSEMQRLVGVRPMGMSAAAR